MLRFPEHFLQRVPATGHVGRDVAGIIGLDDRHANPVLQPEEPRETAGLVEDGAGRRAGALRVERQHDDLTGLGRPTFRLAPGAQRVGDRRLPVAIRPAYLGAQWNRVGQAGSDSRSPHLQG